MDMELKVDEEAIPLNGFVERILKNVLEGIVRELHGVDDGWEEIEIELNK